MKNVAQRRTARWLVAAPVVAALSLGSAACADDQAQEQDSPEITREIEPAPGAADGVVDLAEDGKNLTENLNVPGSDAADEIDE